MKIVCLNCLFVSYRGEKRRIRVAKKTEKLGYFLDKNSILLVSKNAIKLVTTRIT